MEIMEFYRVADVSSAVFQLDQHYDESSNDFHWINNNMFFVYS